MLGQRRGLRTGRGIPNLQSPAHIAGRDPLTVRAEGDGLDCLLMTFDLQELLGAGGIPDPNRLIAADGDDPFAIGAEGDIGDEDFVRLG